MKVNYKRNLIGYGKTLPRVEWPNRKKIALQITEIFTKKEWQQTQSNIFRGFNLLSSSKKEICLSSLFSFHQSSVSRNAIISPEVFLIASFLAWYKVVCCGA